MQSQDSENARCNLKIVQILRLLGTYISSIMFGFTYPAWYMVCMVSGVRFRGAGTYVLSLLVLGLAHSVTHSVGVSLKPRLHVALKAVRKVL